MASRRNFTSGQWAAALGIALALHVLLGWSLLLSIPVVSTAPAGEDGRLAVGTLSLGGVEAPLLSEVAADSAELTMADAATAPPTALGAVAPPEVQPMTEVVPIEPKPRRTIKPKPKAKPKKQQTPKASQSAQSRKGKTNNAARKSKNTDRAGEGRGGKKGPTKGGTAGAERAAAPVPGNPPPRYPSVARSRGHEGRVLIRVSVLGNGRVGSARVAKSSGHGVLDRAALKAVKRWRFKPALRAGKPVTTTLTVPVTFRLEGGRS